MELTQKYDDLKSFIKTLDLSEQQLLLLIGNLLLDQFDSLVDIDRSFNINTDYTYKVDLEDFNSINMLLSIYNTSNALQVSQLAHNIVYISNQIERQEKRLYGTTNE